MTTAGDMYRAGQIDNATKSKILDAYSVYQKAFQAATFALRASSSGATPDFIISDAVRAGMAIVELVTLLKNRRP